MDNSALTPKSGLNKTPNTESQPELLGSGSTTLAELAEFELNIGEMTCAACAGRVERSLNKLSGVTATVNYATEIAKVRGIPLAEANQAILAVTKAGYTAELRSESSDEWTRRATEDKIAKLRSRLMLSAILTVPLMDLTIILALVPSLRFPYWDWLAVLLALPIVTWAALPFHRATFRNLRYGQVSMDTLVSLGIIASFGWAVATLILGDPGNPGHWLGFGEVPAGAEALYLDVAAGMTTFQLAGRYFEARARRRAGNVLTALSELAAKFVRVLRANEEVIIPVAELKIGETLVVLPGETIAADGTVSSGSAAIDTSSMTGESLPKSVEPGSKVVAGTVNTDGRLEIVAESVGNKTQLSQMVELAERAQERKAGIQKIVDRVVTFFIPGVILLSVLIFLLWYLTGSTFGVAFSIAITVLIIACPCALGLATPTALMVGVGRAATLGILIKGQDSLESSGKLSTVVLDKTGTVTTGENRVSAQKNFGAFTEAESWAWAAAIEKNSEHPIAKAILAAAKKKVADLPELSEFKAQPGLGASAKLGSSQLLIGSPKLAEQHGVTLNEAREFINQEQQRGNTVVLLVKDAELVSAFAISDTVKSDAKAAIALLKAKKLKVVLLTGDNQVTAQAVADQLGVDEVFAEVMPSEKAQKILELQAAGERVAMVGDGINDTAALASANLGIAMVSGTDLAMKAADIILVRDDLYAISDAIAISQKTLKTIHGNLFWAFAYNVAAIPIAAIGLLNPLIAALAMSLSSVLVVFNSLRLNSYSPAKKRKN